MYSPKAIQIYKYRGKHTRYKHRRISYFTLDKVDYFTQGDRVGERAQFFYGGNVER